MRRMALGSFIVLMGLVLSSGLVSADGMILPEAIDLDYLTIRYHRVQVSIEDGYAITRVEQEFYNPHPFALQGRYVFPVPPEAAVSAFQLSLDGELQSVAHQDVGATNKLLYDAVVQRQDPTLLQYIDWESLALDLRIPAKGSRQMSLQYEQMLLPSGGLYRYRYVLSVERYAMQPLEEVEVSVDLHWSSELSSVYCSSHDVTTEWLGPGRVRVTWRDENVLPREDLQLFFAPTVKDLSAGLLTGHRNGRDHMMLLLSPVTTPGTVESVPKDVVFVLDRSGSMKGEKIEQARQALQYMLGQLGPQDRFSIISFNERVSVWRETSQPATRQTVTSAMAYLNELQADGNTDLEAALRESLNVLAADPLESQPQMVVFLTDGLPTSGTTDERLIADSVEEANAQLEARLHVFGVGYDVNTHLLDRLAEDNKGSVTYVQPGENLESVLTSFYERIAHPVLTDVQVSFEGMRVSQLYPQRIPDLFTGSMLMLTGLYHAESDRAVVRVRGMAGDGPRTYSYTLQLAELENHDFVPRLWATRRVGELLDRVRVQGETPELVQEVRELGLAYGLVTPYTLHVIASQENGPASMANNALYRRSDLNLAWGQTTIQARVQNQAYQQAVQAQLAAGANVLNYGPHSVAQLGPQNVDLALLQDRPATEEPITEGWIAQNVQVDRVVQFGSAEYLALAADPAARPFLQSGTNVIFAYGGQVISVEDPGTAGVTPDAGTDQLGGSLELDDGPVVELNERSTPQVQGGGNRRSVPFCLGFPGVATLIAVAATRSSLRRRFDQR